jgi:uncharacterized protein YbjQ (UPF0145 family)
MIDLIVFISLVALGYTAGTISEKRHYRSIEQRERDTLKLPVTTFRKLPTTSRAIKGARLVTGNAVISLDYFKRILAGLRNIFGGEVGSYSSLVDRARREALLRMVESAASASVILNVRIETSAIGQSANNRNTVGSIEALAYGTAVYYEKPNASKVHAQAD